MAVIAPIVSTWDPRGVNRAERDLTTFSDRSSRAFGAVANAAKVAALAVAGIAVGAAVGIGKAIDAASNLEEATAKVTQLFGEEATRKVEAFADTAATAFGQTRQQVLDAAGVFGTFGKAAGLSGNDLAEFSTGFTGLASDLASFNNTTPQEAIEAIGAALRGESEPLRRYGVLLDDATLRGKALELGIYDGKGALDSRQKILAAEAVIWEQTADAQGDFARTSKGLANQTRILKASLANVVAELGRKFLPIAVAVARFVNDKVVPTIEKLADTFDKKGLRGVLEQLGGWIEKAIPPALDKLRELIERLGGWIISTGLPWLGRKAKELGSALVNWVRPRIGPAIAQLGEWIAKLGAWIIDVGLPWLGRKALELGGALVDWIEPRIGPAVDKLEEWIGIAVDWIIDEGVPLLGRKTKELGEKLIDWVQPRIKPTLLKLGEWILSITKWIVTDGVPLVAKSSLKLGVALLSWTARIVPDALAALGRLGLAMVNAIPGIFRSVATTMFTQGALLGKRLLEGLSNGFTGLANKAGGIATQIKNAVVGALKSGWNNAIADPVNAAVRGAVQALDTTLGPFVNFPPAPNIVPRLARGGIVDSPTLALIGDRTLSGGTRNREAVVPLDRLEGGAGHTFVINGAIDPVATARQIRRILNQDANRRGAPAVLS